MKKQYHEVQRFDQVWLWLILIASAGFGIFTIIDALPNLKQTGSIFGLLLGGFVLISVVLLLFIIRLRTVINSKGIQIHFYPLFKKNFDWEEIESAEVIRYGFIGGWGIRFWPKYGMIYNIKGKVGIQIKMKKGGRYLIGTQNPEEIKYVLNNRNHLESTQH